MGDQHTTAAAPAVEVFRGSVKDFPQSVTYATTFGVVKRRWHAIAGLATAVGVLTFLLCQTLTPLYAGKTVVMIDTRTPSPAASRTSQTAMAPSEETLKKNEIAIIRSRRLLRAVVARFSLDEDAEFNPDLRPISGTRHLLDWSKSMLSRVAKNLTSAQGKPFELPKENARDQAVDILLNKLATTSTDASRVIEIRALAENPETAARISNAIADEYISAKIEQQISGPESIAERLEKDITLLNQRINNSERNIEEMRRQRGLMPAANAKVLADELAELTKQRSDAARARVVAEGRLQELRSASGSGAVESAISVLDSPLIQRLRAEASLLDAKIGDMSTTYGERHPKIAQARAELEDLRAQIAAETAKIARSYRNAIAVAKANEAALSREHEQLKTQATKADESEADVRMLERATDADRALLTQLAARLNETKAQIKLQGAEAWVLSKATVPRAPTFPPTLAITAAAVLISAAAGTLSAIALDRSDRSIRSIEQIRQFTSARVLGTIPILKEARNGRRFPHQHVVERRRSQVAEHLRAICFQIDKVKLPPAKVLLITSSLAREGKSSIAIGLAYMMALAGRRVAIVDADLRNSSVHRALGMENSPGLADLLEGKVELDQVLQFTSVPRVGVIVAGFSFESPAEVLQSPRMYLALRALADNFDMIVVDSPPLLVVPDASILAQHADATIMVVRWGETKTTAFASALQTMSDLEIPLTGVVLSMVNVEEYRRQGYLE